MLPQPLTPSLPAAAVPPVAAAPFPPLPPPSVPPLTPPTPERLGWPLPPASHARMPRPAVTISTRRVDHSHRAARWYTRASDALTPATALLCGRAVADPLLERNDVLLGDTVRIAAAVRHPRRRTARATQDLDQSAVIGSARIHELDASARRRDIRGHVRVQVRVVLQDQRIAWRCVSAEPVAVSRCATHDWSSTTKRRPHRL